MSSKVSIQGRNYETITRNNISNKFSGHRTRPGKDYPVPGIVDHNWSGNFKNAVGPIKGHNIEPIYFHVILNQGKY